MNLKKKTKALQEQIEYFEKQEAIWQMKNRGLIENFQLD